MEIGYSQSATNGEVVDEIIRIVTEFDPVTLVIDQRSAAAPIRPLLEQAGIEPTLTNASQLAVSCGGFLDDALAGQLSHTGQQVLNDAVASAVKRDLPGGGFAWDETPGASIAQLVAATLSHWALLEFGSSPPKVIAKPLMDAGRTRDDDDEFDRVLGPNVDILTMPF